MKTVRERPYGEAADGNDFEDAKEYLTREAQSKARTRAKAAANELSRGMDVLLPCYAVVKRNGVILIPTRICSKEFSFATKMESEKERLDSTYPRVKKSRSSGSDARSRTMQSDRNSFRNATGFEMSIFPVSMTACRIIRRN